MENYNSQPEIAPVGDEIHLRDIWNLLVRNRWVIFLTLVLVVGAAAFFTFTAIPVYESKVTIRIDEERSNVPVLDILQTISQGSQVETEMEVLRSRTLAEDVVDSLDLQLVVREPRGVARADLLRRIFVERWAPDAVYRLERQGNGTFAIVEEETGEAVGSVSAT